MKENRSPRITSKIELMLLVQSGSCWGQTLVILPMWILSDCRRLLVAFYGSFCFSDFPCDSLTHCFDPAIVSHFVRVPDKTVPQILHQLFPVITFQTQFCLLWCSVHNNKSCAAAICVHFHYLLPYALALKRNTLEYILKTHY